MKLIYQPTTLPEWFTIAAPTAEFTANELREVLGCCLETSFKLVKNLEEIKTNKPSVNYKIATGRKTAKRFSKQTVLELIESLPIKKEACQ